MAQDHHRRQQKLRQVLIFYPPSVYTAYEEDFSTKFDILKAYQSPLPTDLFLETHAQSVTAVLCSGKSLISADVIRRLPSLQCVVTDSAGVDHVDLAESRRRGISVANAGSVFSEEVADVAVGLVIDVLRRISAADRFVRAGLWPINGDYRLGSKLGGKRVGIVGLGRIGSKVAKRLDAFGCIISYNSREKKQLVVYPFYSNVIELASNCDILIICCALTDHTRHMINRQVISALGKDGIVVNIARGAVLDEEELVKSLVQGEIGGAGLDVFENEPNVPKELFGLDNVVMSPHKSAFTEESFFDAFQIVMGNLEAFFSNKPLLSLVP